MGHLCGVAGSRSGQGTACGWRYLGCALSAKRDGTESKSLVMKGQVMGNEITVHCITINSRGRATPPLPFLSRPYVDLLPPKS